MAGEVRLTGIREPSLIHGGAPQDMPAAALRSRQWRLTSDSGVIAHAIGTSDAVVFGDTRLAASTLGILVPAAVVAAPAPDKRPKPSPSAVRQWMLDRVETWPRELPAPLEAKDWAAVGAHFGEGLRRSEDFRPIREKNTPKEWRTRGPRKPWGQVLDSRRNSAMNSAKLPPQN